MLSVVPIQDMTIYGSDITATLSISSFRYAQKLVDQSEDGKEPKVLNVKVTWGLAFKADGSSSLRIWVCEAKLSPSSARHSSPNMRPILIITLPKLPQCKRQIDSNLVHSAERWLRLQIWLLNWVESHSPFPFLLRSNNHIIALHWASRLQLRLQLFNFLHPQSWWTQSAIVRLSRLSLSFQRYIAIRKSEIETSRCSGQAKLHIVAKL